VFVVAVVFLQHPSLHHHLLYPKLHSQKYFPIHISTNELFGRKKENPTEMMLRLTTTTIASTTPTAMLSGFLRSNSSNIHGCRIGSSVVATARRFNSSSLLSRPAACCHAHRMMMMDAVSMPNHSNNGWFSGSGSYRMHHLRGTMAVRNYVQPTKFYAMPIQTIDVRLLFMLLFRDEVAFWYFFSMSHTYLTMLISQSLSLFSWG
jgi:hypothetical protein